MKAKALENKGTVKFKLQIIFNNDFIFAFFPKYFTDTFIFINCSHTYQKVTTQLWVFYFSVLFCFKSKVFLLYFSFNYFSSYSFLNFHHFPCRAAEVNAGTSIPPSLSLFPLHQYLLLGTTSMLFSIKKKDEQPPEQSGSISLHRSTN